METEDEEQRCCAKEVDTETEAEEKQQGGR